MTISLPTVLLLDLEGLPVDWAQAHGQAMPFLRGLLEQGVWGQWAAPGFGDPDEAWPSLYAGPPESPLSDMAATGVGQAGQVKASTDPFMPSPGHRAPSRRHPARLWRELARAGVPVGLCNLPGLWPPPPVHGWAVARIQSPDQARHFTHPPELALDLGEYQSGQLSLVGRPVPKPQQRDEVYALWACLARLVWDQALRLLQAQPPRLAGLGFQGLGQVYNMFADDPGRLDLLLAQVDEYLGRMAALLRSRGVLCLAGQAGFLAWGPGLIRPGRMAGARPEDLTPVLLGLLGLDIPPDWAGRPPGGIWR